MPDENGTDNIVANVYKMIMTFFTGVVVQCRFRWFEGVYYNSLSTLGKYLFDPIFLIKLAFDLFRPTLPMPHFSLLPNFVNRTVLSEEPKLINPPDMCRNGRECQKKRRCKHVGKRIIVYINGSYTNRAVFCDNLNIVSNMFVVPCFGFYNPTSSVFVDTLMDFIQRYTPVNKFKAVELLNSMVRLINTHKGLDEIIILAHGSGGLLAEQFLRLLRDLNYPLTFINKFKFVLVGTPVCNMKWSRDDCGKLISFTGEYLHERTDSLGNKRPHRAYYKSKFYCGLCCDVDHSKAVPCPYIESIYNSGDLIASAGVANKSKLCQTDMIDVDGVKIEIPDTFGHYNYHLIDDNNYKYFCRSYLARDYNVKYSGDSCSNFL